MFQLKGIFRRSQFQVCQGRYDKNRERPDFVIFTFGTLKLRNYNSRVIEREVSTPRIPENAASRYGNFLRDNFQQVSPLCEFLGVITS
jgi:hypothetical protein